MIPTGGRILLLSEYKEILIFSVVPIPGDGGKCALFSGSVEIVASTGLFKRIMYENIQMEVQLYMRRRWKALQGQV